ncbi:MAG: MMPL family transporter [Bacteroidota bacterium]
MIVFIGDMQIHPNRNYLYLFTFLALGSIYYVFNLKFTFSLNDFFPEGDRELVFYQDFIEEFETDINFLLIALERKEGVFDSTFLNEAHDFTLQCKRLPEIKTAQSLTTLSYPLKTPFSVTAIPMIHLDQPAKYERDKQRILNDERFIHTLISEDADALNIALKTIDSIGLEASATLINGIEVLMEQYHFEDYHILGPAYFQKEMVDMQKREVAVSAVVSAILVSLILFWIFRRMPGIAISLVSIGLGLLLFMGLLGLSGRPLNAMAALYPVLMIIVGTSDVIHIMSKYIDELKKGVTKKAAIQVTIREIGLATLLTSVTTAIGFASLMSSRIGPIQDFGMNAAVGVIVAYITVIFFTTSLLIYFDADQLIKPGRGQAFWGWLMNRWDQFTRENGRSVALGAGLVLLLCFWGISMITTNYRISSNLPRGEKISTDFRYFEETFAGFRPLEVAVFAQGDYQADDFEVVQEIEKLEQYLRTYPELGSINSPSTIYKSIHRMYKGNKAEAYQMPERKATFEKYKKLAARMPAGTADVLLSRDRKKARITSRILDMGADSIQLTSRNIDNWIELNMDTTIAKYHQTGTGLILDKNAEYVRRNLIGGLGMAVLIVSLLMAILFKNWRMVIISLVPNVFPLLLAGALLGFFGIELDAGISIVFAVVFGIAVDDTIHFLSKYKLCRNKGMGIDDALHTTFMETGKAICLTTIILFFGFLVMLFSIHPPSVNVGLLISLTLFSALISDLMLIPILVRWLEKDEPLVTSQRVNRVNAGGL